MPISKHAAELSESDTPLWTNRIYCSEKEVKLDFSKKNLEEFPFWEII